MNRVENIMTKGENCFSFMMIGWWMNNYLKSKCYNPFPHTTTLNISRQLWRISKQKDIIMENRLRSFLQKEKLLIMCNFPPSAMVSRVASCRSVIMPNKVGNCYNYHSDLLIRFLKCKQSNLYLKTTNGKRIWYLFTGGL